MLRRLAARTLVAAAALVLVAVSLHHSAQLRRRFREEARLATGGGGRAPGQRQRGGRSTLPDTATRPPGLETFPFDDDGAGDATAPRRVGEIFQDPTARDEAAFPRHPGEGPLHEFVDGHGADTLHRTDEAFASEAEAAEAAVDEPEDLDVDRLETGNTSPAEALDTNATKDNRTQGEGPSDPGDYPPLQDLIERGGGETVRVRGDVQFLLDFALVGFPHAGADRLADWMAHQGGDRVALPLWRRRRRPPLLSARHAGELVEGLHRQWRLPPPTAANRTQHARRVGYYNPYDIHYTAALRTLKRHFPRTKLVIGVRHPVLWFQDWYNGLRRTTGRNGTAIAPPPEDLVGPRLPALARCHVFLSLLGKAGHDGRARQLLEGPYALWAQRVQAMRAAGGADGGGGPDEARMANPVFLYEARQVLELDAGRRETFFRDLAKFLELEGEPLMLNVSIAPSTGKGESGEFNICQEQYRDLRTELMEVSMRASVWLQYHLLRSPDVTVPSSHDMTTILGDWFADPCEAPHSS